MLPRWPLLLGGLFLLLLGRVAALVTPGASKYLLDEVVAKRRAELLPWLLGAVAGAVVVQATTSLLLTQLLGKSAHRLIADLRARVQAHIGRLAVRYYDQNKVGALVSRIMSDAEGVRNLVGTGLLELVGGVVTASVAVLVLLKLNPALTGTTLAFLGLFGLVVRRAFQVLRPIYRERSRIQAEVAGRLSESLGGVRVVKGFRAEEREAAVFAEGARRIFDNVARTLNTSAVLGLSSTLLMGVVGVLVMGYGGHLMLEGRMTVGDFVAFMLYLGMLIAPVFQVVGIGSQLQEAFAGLDRIEEVFAEEPEDRDPRRSETLDEVRGEVVFEEVGFEYEPGKPVLKGIHLSAAPGTVTALVGPSGSGKSTIIGLVAAFETPTTGRVLVDGHDLARVRLGSYRSRLGVVLQDTFLFDGTIRENIAFGRPGASPEEVERAAAVAHVDEFADRFEKGLDTLVGERGVKLSGGQRQRVAIARAVVAEPRILILDEATSTLDSENEAYIQEGLKRLLEGRTTFVIAHRLSTIRHADQILVVEDGRIVERGRHQELLDRGGRYHELYTRQAGLVANRFLNPGETAERERETTAAEAAAPASEGGARPLDLLSGRG